MIIIIITITQASTSFISTDEHHMDAQYKYGASSYALVAAIVVGLAVGCKGASDTLRVHVNAVKGVLDDKMHRTLSQNTTFCLPS
jgi:hypothetical protein